LAEPVNGAEIPNRISLSVTPRVDGTPSLAPRTDATRAESSPMGRGSVDAVGERAAGELSCSGVFKVSSANLDTTAVLSVLSPSTLLNSDGNLPVMNSASAAPINAAMARPARTASRRRARGAGGGSLRNSGSSERGLRNGGCSPSSGRSPSASGLRARGASRASLREVGLSGRCARA
jgi:hypothetical protein